MTTKKKQQQPSGQLQVEGSTTISVGKRSLSISLGEGGNDNNNNIKDRSSDNSNSRDEPLKVTTPILTLTNEYGNSMVYTLNEHSFGGLWSQLWQFVKDSQH